MKIVLFAIDMLVLERCTSSVFRKHAVMKVNCIWKN